MFEIFWVKMSRVELSYYHTSDLISKGVSESEIILAGELIKRQKMAEQQRRRRPNVVLTDRDNYDYDFLYYL